ncbi:MAG: diaminopimelate epimerase [Bacillota bacterium]
MRIGFTKMHGAGNDFIMVNGFKYKIAAEKYKELARKLCDRHFSIGGDGLIIALPAENKIDDFRMRIFNSDGSEAEMCGNGIRCFAHFLKEEKLTDKHKLKVETLAGIITPEIITHTEHGSQVKVNMGKPRFKPDKIPIKLDDTLEFVLDYELEVYEETLKINCVSMGNPHTIIFTDDVEKYKLDLWGKKIENHSLFPEKTNVEFIEIISRDEIIMKVWERGAGITLACGTGASASVVAGIKKGYLDNEVLVHLPGGDLIIKWFGENVYMTGPSERIFSGKIEIKEKREDF